MKNILKILSIALTILFFAGCTSDFDEINTKPDGFKKEELSAKYFFTGPQVNLYGPSRYPYWRGHLIHADRYAGHFCFGHNQMWWSDELGYKYSSGYTDATWNWLAGAIGGIDNFIKLTQTGGDFENEKMYAVGKILKSLYFQMFTDIWGMVPYSEAGKEGITLPKFDSQLDIYKGVIAELDEAMKIIGDSEKTGVGVADLGDNDVFYNGDLQKWKKLANTLKLRMAMRALGAEGANFAEEAIKQAIAAPLIANQDENCLLSKDVEISQWASASYGDVWYNFGAGSDWKVSKYIIDFFRENNDPRMEKYAQTAKGGEAKIIKPEKNADKHEKRLNFLLATLDDAGVAYTKRTEKDTTFINVPENTYYIGQPVRINGDTNPYVVYNFFSNPAEYIIAKKGKGSKISPEIVMTTAEAYFLRAEAALRGLSSDNAEEMFKEGIKQAMLLWEVSAADADNYIATADAAKLTGSLNEKIGKIAMQRWIAGYTDGFEAWAVVRDYGYTGFTKLYEGVTDGDIFGLGDINGTYPTRMRYGNEAVNTNGENVKAAIAKQGADEQDTKLWWAK